MRTAILGLVAVAALAIGAESASAQVWMNRQVNPWTGNVYTAGWQRNPWTGTTAMRNTVYNPWTGGVATNTMRANPWMGVQRSGAVVNPWTGQVGRYNTFRRW